MRRIEKRSPPASLVQFLRENPPVYADLRGAPKQELRERLVADQGALCCYCMRRIRAHEQGMRIEHFRCQRRYPALQLDWRNLLGACSATSVVRRADQTCDVRKDDADLQLDPLTLRPDQIRYGIDGRISSADPRLQPELDTILNLNVAALVRARRQARDELVSALRRELGAEAPWNRAALERKLRALRGRSELPQFLGLLEYWLERHAKAR